MKSRNSRRFASEVPEVNLVPMMDVLMTVLTFFIIISMGLSSQQILTVDAPDLGEGSESEVTQEDIAPPPLVIGLNAQGEILIDDEPISKEQLAAAMRDYLTANPDGYVRLKADRELEYADVAELLVTMRDIGGGRVSLAIE
ncbi:MAG: biopolymer transporter ExbD [Synechococcales bacterium]|nr:biopolymer transporter ExbD [Synechococcales bacterium]